MVTVVSVFFETRFKIMINQIMMNEELYNTMQKRIRITMLTSKQFQKIF